MRRSFALFSLFCHSAAIASLLVAQLFAIGPLPTPRRTLSFDNVRFAKLVDIELPAPPRRQSAHSEAPGSATSINAAPIAQPAFITPETGQETETATATAVDGVEHDGGSSLDTVIGHGVPPPPPVPPDPIVPTTPARLGSGVIAPSKTVDVSPVYPPIARSARVQGIVILEAVIDARGRVESARVLRSIPLLDQAAVDAVLQ